MNNTKRYHKNTGENLFCDKYLFQEAMRSNPNTFLMKLNELVIGTNIQKVVLICIKPTERLGHQCINLN
jgi:hypothetical protein